MKTQILPLSILFACASQALYAAEDLPKRKPGLWEIDRQSPSMRMAIGPIQLCVGEKSDDFLLRAGEMAQNCEKPAITRNGGELRFKSSCKINQMTVTTEGVFTGDFSSSYHGELHSAFDPPMHGKTESASIITAKWLGPCKEGQKPGDALVQSAPGGPRNFNIEEMMKMRERLQSPQK
jgi:hypothetical protein